MILFFLHYDHKLQKEKELTHSCQIEIIDYIFLFYLSFMESIFNFFYIFKHQSLMENKTHMFAIYRNNI
jgi:hypothetical protein